MERNFVLCPHSVDVHSIRTVLKYLPYSLLLSRACYACRASRAELAGDKFRSEPQRNKVTGKVDFLDKNVSATTMTQKSLGLVRLRRVWMSFLPS